jgi:regulator of protease activity HflC (stomatin/prohibitin superfamily)
MKVKNIVLLSLVALILQSCVFFTVREQHEAIVENWGKFDRVAKAGFNFKNPFTEDIYDIELRVQQIDVKVETKTLDNVFVNVNISVQYYISDVKNAFYKLKNPKAQISSYIFDVIRSEVPKLSLDNTFLQKDKIAEAIKNELTDAMKGFGFTIIKTLVTDIDPNQKVKDAMNEINAATRLRQAAMEKGEAEKILIVKRAEADAESRSLRGKGVAQERIEIARGLEESIKLIKSSVKGANISENEIVSTLMMTQYFDAMKAIGTSSGTHTLFVQSGAGAVGDIQNQIIGGMRASK